LEQNKGTLPGHEAIRLDAVLKAVELPARISHLDASLPDVNAYDLPHLLWFLLLPHLQLPWEFRILRTEKALQQTGHGRRACGRAGGKKEG
jgi:hypothetical protein